MRPTALTVQRGSRRFSPWWGATNSPMMCRSEAAMRSPTPQSEPPLFSVIIPCKNRGQYLAHTLRTCSTQKYERLEIIVSDDGSTDDTREVVHELARTDARIRYTSPV